MTSPHLLAAPSELKLKSKPRLKLSHQQDGVCGNDSHDDDSCRNSNLHIDFAFFPLFFRFEQPEKNLGSMGSKRGKAGFLLLTVDFIP